MQFKFSEDLRIQQPLTNLETSKSVLLVHFKLAYFSLWVTFATEKILTVYITSRIINNRVNNVNETVQLNDGDN